MDCNDVLSACIVALGLPINMTSLRSLPLLLTLCALCLFALHVSAASGPVETRSDMTWVYDAREFADDEHNVRINNTQQTVIVHA